MKYMEFVSVIASASTLIGFIAIFIKLGRDKGAQEVTIKEIRKTLMQMLQTSKILKARQTLCRLKIQN